MSKARIRIANLSDKYVVVGHYANVKGIMRIRQIAPKSVEEFDLENIDRELVFRSQKEGKIFYDVQPAMAEPLFIEPEEEEVEVSRFELMEM